MKFSQWNVIHTCVCTCTAKHVLRGNLCDKEKVALQDRWPLKKGSIHMKFFMTAQENGDLLIQVTA